VPAHPGSPGKNPEGRKMVAAAAAAAAAAAPSLH